MMDSMISGIKQMGWGGVYNSTIRRVVEAEKRKIRKQGNDLVKLNE